MKVLIILGVIAVAFANKQCGKNQHYNSCGTACPTTCDNKDDGPRPCILICKSGCHCDAGYVRNADNECVRPEECPAKSEPVCGQNERYNECGTACPLTCDNYRNPPRFCNLMCKIGCECEQGFVRAPNGRCIRSFACPQNTTTLKSCLGAPETGMCKAYFPRYHYDIQSGVCKRFIYGGCGGNGNNYETEEECMNHCEGMKLKQASLGLCDLPAETGVCKGYFPRFHFDIQTGECKKFIYGGCGGNENNFESVEECKNSCVARASADVCELPAETGVCDAYFRRFYFNKNTGKCERFVYGGCGGNGNNFNTEEECQNRCGAVVKKSNALCELEKVVGPCRARMPRYFYNKATGECEQFIYGGCRGNANNFKTLDQCHEICKA